MADSFVQQDSPTGNFGASDAMHVSGDKLEQFKRSFVLFDTASIPAGATIDAAELTLCFEHEPSPAAQGWVHELRRVNDDWAEAGLTWNNQPDVSGAVSATLIVPASGSCESYAVTADVQSWVDGAANNGWRVNSEDEGTGGGNVRLATRDHPEASVHPRLDLTYTLP